MTGFWWVPNFWVFQISTTISSFAAFRENDVKSQLPHTPLSPKTPKCGTKQLLSAGHRLATSPGPGSATPSARKVSPSRKLALYQSFARVHSCFPLHHVIHHAHNHALIWWGRQPSARMEFQLYKFVPVGFEGLCMENFHLHLKQPVSFCFQTISSGLEAFWFEASDHEPQSLLFAF